MLKDIEIARELGADGVVIGCLTAEGEVDMQRNRELIDAAGTMSVTFHRAFDMCRDPFESLEKIILLGCDRILTSGQEPKAEQGIPLLNRSEEHTSELQSRPHLVCRLLLEKKKTLIVIHFLTVY